MEVLSALIYLKYIVRYKTPPHKQLQPASREVHGLKLFVGLPLLCFHRLSERIGICQYTVHQDYKVSV